MRARIHDKQKNRYYISEVYGVVNRAGDWYIVEDAEEKGSVVLVEYLDFDTKPPHEVNVESIDQNPVLWGEWINIDRSQVNGLNEKLVKSKKVHYFRGYKNIWEASQALAELLENGSMDKSAFGLKNISTKLAGWNYIETQTDIDELMKAFKGFHDAILKELSYVTGEYVDKDGMRLNPAGAKQIRLTYNSDWADEIEIVLLSPRICHLVPGEENYTAELLDASMFIKDCMVHFYDSYMESIPDEYVGTYFQSMGLMWRYAPK